MSGDPYLPPRFSFCEVYGDDVNGPTRWALLCDGIQWGPGPRDASGASGATWATKQEAADFLLQIEPHVVSEGGTPEAAAYWAASKRTQAVTMKGRPALFGGLAFPGRR